MDKKEECPNCGYIEKLNYLYDLEGNKQGDKRYCQNCINEHHEEEQKAFNEYYLSI